MTERSPDALGRSILVNANALQGTCEPASFSAAHSVIGDEFCETQLT